MIQSRTLLIQYWVTWLPFVTAAHAFADAKVLIDSHTPSSSSNSILGIRRLSFGRKSELALYRHRRYRSLDVSRTLLTSLRGGEGETLGVETNGVDSLAISNLRNNVTSSVVPLRQYNARTLDAGSMTIPQLFQILHSHPVDGLTSAQASERLAYFGRNELVASASQSLWQLFVEQFQDRLVQILLVIAAVSALFSVLEVQQHLVGTVGGAGNTVAETSSIWKFFVEPTVILVILLLNAAVGVWQSTSASDSLAELHKLQPVTTTVIRDQHVLPTFPAGDIAVGDIIKIRVGDKLPADARLISVLTPSGLQVDESSLTGESVPVSKLAGEEGTIRIVDNSSTSTTADNSMHTTNLAVVTATTTDGIPLHHTTAVLQDQVGMLYSGSLVTRGSGVALVTHTGMNTQIGLISQGVARAAAESIPTPLEMKLNEFSTTLTVVIGVICLAVWIVSIPKMNDPGFPNVWQGAIYYAKVAVALGVAAIPEGLPAVITLCLSLGTRRMAERNVIVRKLSSVETLGCTSVICTDKTGTLTTNEMVAVSLVVFERDPIIPASSLTDNMSESVTEHAVYGISYSPIGQVEGIAKNIEVKLQPLGAIADIAAVCALCNDARIIGNDSIEEPVKKKLKTKDKHADAKTTSSELLYKRTGDATEAALCVLVEKLGGMSIDLEDSFLETSDPIRGLQENPTPSVLASANVNAWRERHHRVATLEFGRDRKSMSVLSRLDAADCPTPNEILIGIKPRNAGNRLLVKGAPSLLINRCTNVKFRDGTVAQMSGKLRRSLEKKISDMEARPLRCLALAVKENEDLEESLKDFHPKRESEITRHPLLSDPANYLNVESGLCLVGVVGIKDPARPEAADSITKCSEAGIRVIMITGDAKDTAIAIARDVNIFDKEIDQKDVKAFEGREFFRKIHCEQLDILRKDNIVFYRTEPSDKQRLVKMLQSLNEIAAMTGDGVNDAPALQQAAIAVAMGVTGTEVAKEAADMILADDNFSTIVNAVEEGRRIYSNMQAFICFLISCNVGEICAIFLATLAGFPEPLTAMHLLWVNLVTDGPPATALGFNPPAPDLMKQPPRPSDEPIMTKWLLTRYCLTGLYVGIATIGVFIQHYVSQGITLSQLASWSQCGEFWSPTSGIMCVDLFQGSGRMLPQTLALTTLVVIEMLKALSAVSVDSSIFRIGPQSNPWLIAGVSGPLLLHLLVLYSSNIGLPGLGESFGMVPLSIDDWVNVLAWATPVLLVEEVLKAIGRCIHLDDRGSKNKTKIQKPEISQMV